jgi:demethylmenaquinone methyltransferase/2-methoxy-6-polyprenyl-1,4-benzoquinol methylase
MAASLKAALEVRAPQKTETGETLFSAIAPTYDLLNHIFSFQLDRLWRNALVRRSGLRDGAAVLDACTGTGDLAVAFARDGKAESVTGFDVSDSMLSRAAKKIEKRGLEGRVRLFRADLLDLGSSGEGLFASKALFDVAGLAFGLRNLSDPERGLAELSGVLKKGGRLLVLEFTPPRGGWFGEAYHLYLRSVIPRLGRLISRTEGAYDYLRSSIEGFMSPGEVLRLMRQVGLKRVRAKRLTAGIVYLYVGRK